MDVDLVEVCVGKRRSSSTCLERPSRLRPTLFDWTDLLPRRPFPSSRYVLVTTPIPLGHLLQRGETERNVSTLDTSHLSHRLTEAYKSLRVTVLTLKGTTELRRLVGTVVCKKFNKFFPVPNISTFGVKMVGDV